MDRQFPYANLHDLNIDWILQIVKEFKEKYNTVDALLQQARTASEHAEELLEQAQETLAQVDQKAAEAIAAIESKQSDATSALNDLYDTLETALETLENTLEGSLNTKTTELLQSLTTYTAQKLEELRTATATNIQTINTTGTNQQTLINNAGTSALNDITRSRNDAIDAIEELPPYIYDGVQLCKSVIFGLRNFPEIKQGTYVNGVYTENANRVCTEIIHNPNGAYLHLGITGTDCAIDKVCYWMNDDTYSEVSEYPNQQINVTIAANVKDIAIVFSRSSSQSASIVPSEITADFWWEGTGLSTMFVCNYTNQGFNGVQKRIARNNIDAVSIIDVDSEDDPSGWTILGVIHNA